MLHLHRRNRSNQTGNLILPTPPAAPKVEPLAPLPIAPTGMECPICLTNPPSILLDCSHSLCGECYTTLAPGNRTPWSTPPLCPLCRCPHLAVHPSLHAELGTLLKTAINSFKISESTIEELKRAKGAYLGKLLGDLNTQRTSIDESIQDLMDANRQCLRETHVNPAQLNPIAPEFIPAPAVVVVQGTFPAVFGAPLFTHGIWTGRNGFRFQSLASCPQVGEGETHIGNNILRRDLNPELDFIPNRWMAMLRFGLMPPGAVELWRVWGEAGEFNVPPAVRQVCHLLNWYMTKGAATNYRAPMPAFATDENVIAFYGGNEPFWYADPPGDTTPLVGEISELLTWCKILWLNTLFNQRSESREGCQLFFAEWQKLPYPLASEFHIIANTYFPFLRTSKRCAGCHNLAPAHTFYYGRRGNEPRRVRCEGCTPRHSWVQAWDGEAPVVD
jgi:hypothetical protein